MQDSLPSIICMGRRLWLGLGSLGVSHQRPMLDARRPKGDPWRRHGWINAFCVWAQMTLMKEPETEIFFERLAVTHFVGDKAVNWISVFFTDGVSAKCSFLSFKCSMFTVQLHPPLHFCLSLLTVDGPVWTLKCCISYISYITCAPGWNCEGALCEHRQCESFGRCAKHMDCSGQGEIGKLGFSFTETRCYFSVGGKVKKVKPNEVFKFLPASICSTCVLFFVRSIFWERSVIMKRSLKAAPRSSPSTQHPIKTQLTAGAGCQHASANSEGLSLGTEALRQNCNQQTVKLVGKDN